MNCKPGDMAIVKTTHPLERLHGALVECIRFEGTMSSLRGRIEHDVWYFRFLGSPKENDNGGDGFIQDRFLRPVKGDPQSADTPTNEEIAA
jgi:hypothetical protein